MGQYLIAPAAAALLLGFVHSADAAPFEPKMDDICTPSPATPSSSSKIDRDQLVDAALDTEHVTLYSLGPRFKHPRSTRPDEKGLGPQDWLAIMLSPEDACGKDGSFCRKGTLASLGKAQTDVQAFLERHLKPLPKDESGFEITRVRQSPPTAIPLQGPVPLQEFFDSSTKYFEASCVSAAAAPIVKTP